MADNFVTAIFDAVFGPIFQDHVTEFPGRYMEVPSVDKDGNPVLGENGDQLVDHIPDEGCVLQEGTPQNATNFNFLRRGMEAANLKGDMLGLFVRQLRDEVDALRGEAGSVELVNSEAQPFNNSETTVTLAQPRNTADYDVRVGIEDYSGGLPGHVLVYSKQRNAFKIRYTGSATAVHLNYVVAGGTK